jgi:hypothetical protein
MPHGQELSVTVYWRRELVPGLICGQPEGQTKRAGSVLFPLSQR